VFAWWGRTVYRYRFIVIGVMVGLCLIGGLFGMSLGSHVTQSGFYDDGSQSVKASVLADDVYGRDRRGHIVAIFDAPQGKTVDDPAWSKNVADELNKFKADHPDQVLDWAGYLRAITASNPDAAKAAQENVYVRGTATKDKTRTFVNISLKGNNDDTILNNYKAIESDLKKLNDGNIELAGLQPLANELTGTIGKDQQRAEVLALPLVAVVLFFVFGGWVPSQRKAAEASAAAAPIGCWTSWAIEAVSCPIVAARFACASSICTSLKRRSLSRASASACLRSVRSSTKPTP
jgi:trehalose monomycolate/heme transporter